MGQPTTDTWDSATDVAVKIRSALKALFPGVKFAVRSSKYAGGSSVRVLWDDGPTTKAVDAVVGGFEGKGFDGMTDSTYYKRPADGSRNGSYVFTQRDVTDWDARYAAALGYATAHFVEGTAWHALDRIARAMVQGRDYRKPETLEQAFERSVNS